MGVEFWVVRFDARYMPWGLMVVRFDEREVWWKWVWWEGR